MQEAQWKFRSQEHSNKVRELFGWACEVTEESNKPFDLDYIMNVMRDHPEYDQVFKGLILTKSKENNGFTMFKAEDVLEGIKLN